MAVTRTFFIAVSSPAPGGDSAIPLAFRSRTGLLADKRAAARLAEFESAGAVQEHGPSDLSHHAGPNHTEEANASQGVRFESVDCTDYTRATAVVTANSSRLVSTRFPVRRANTRIGRITIKSAPTRLLWPFRARIREAACPCGRLKPGSVDWHSILVSHTVIRAVQCMSVISISCFRGGFYGFSVCKCAWVYGESVPDSFPAPKDRNCTKYSRQRRHVQRDLPLRTPQRGSGKSEQSRLRASGPDIGTITSLRQPPPAAPAKNGFGRFMVNAACCVDLFWIYRGSLPLSTPWPWRRPVAAVPIPPCPVTRGPRA